MYISYASVICQCNSLVLANNFFLHYMYIIFNFQVSIDIDNQNEWKECLKVNGVRLPTGYFFGASAATGDLAGQ